MDRKNKEKKKHNGKTRKTRRILRKKSLKLLAKTFHSIFFKETQTQQTYHKQFGRLVTDGNVRFEDVKMEGGREQAP